MCKHIGATLNKIRRSISSWFTLRVELCVSLCMMNMTLNQAQAGGNTWFEVRVLLSCSTVQ